MMTTALPMVEDPATHPPQERKRRLQLSAVPTRTEIRNIEFDLTLECNLRCRYCYKGDRRSVYMPRRVAFDAVIWLIYASGQHKDISIFFMGGEPLMNYDLIKQLVPFGIRRARQHGKNLTFGMTTNGTLVTDEVIEFFRKWNVSFHTSIDGIPEVQDKNRPLASGKPSSPLVEKAVRKILAYRPQTSARCSYDSENAHHVFANYQYFRSLGYTSIVMIPALSANWSDDVVEVLEEQYNQIADVWMDELRKGTFISFKHFEDYCRNHKREKRGTVSCGAGRAYGMIDAEGDYYPCSRWAIHGREQWAFGNIYEAFWEEKRDELMAGFPESSFLPECATCNARSLCSGGCAAENFDTVGHPFQIIPVSCKIMNMWYRVGKRVHDTLYEEKCPTFMQRYYPKEVPQNAAANTVRGTGNGNARPAPQQVRPVNVPTAPDPC